MGERLRSISGRLSVPNNPEIVFIEGDGIGPEIWQATSAVIDAAVETAYGGLRRIHWVEALAGEKAFANTGEWLPESTVNLLRERLVGIKGPLTTPVGEGIRSLNVLLRKRLGLYACVRPVRWYANVPSSVNNPDQLDIVIFRENMEDVYAGIEFMSNSPEARKLIEFINSELQGNLSPAAAIGIKPITEENSKRLIRKAICYAIDHNRRSVTLVHKGNIMKYTEAAFREWGYQVAREEFPDRTIPERELHEASDVRPEGRIVIKDRIADNMFQQLLLRPAEYDVLATTNLNGDYLSDAAAAQVGGLGMAPGANLSDELALFEATHGSADKYAGRDSANPSSLILSGAMMLQHLSWHEAADLIIKALQSTLQRGIMTQDLARKAGVSPASCSTFAGTIADTIISSLKG